MQNKEILKIIGRNGSYFTDDLRDIEDDLSLKIQSSRFLVVGGAGSIGKAVTTEIFKRTPLTLHIVDLSENNLVELVRALRSTYGYITGDFQAIPLDCGSDIFNRMTADHAPYDFILNLSAMKHVRSEKDVYSLMRMIDTNVFNAVKLANRNLIAPGGKYFCVSTDKAANPANLMGASKRIMELYLSSQTNVDVSFARFANVAFSDGSLLHGFTQRIANKQPLSFPIDIKRYFMTELEAGQLCLISALFANNNEIMFPRPSNEISLTSFDEIANRFLKSFGYESHLCDTEEAARNFFSTSKEKNSWPCFSFKTDTTGEKPYEEFFTSQDTVDFSRFLNIGVIKSDLRVHDLEAKLLDFRRNFNQLKSEPNLQLTDFVHIIRSLVPNLQYFNAGKNLDEKM